MLGRGRRRDLQWLLALDKPEPAENEGLALLWPGGGHLLRGRMEETKAGPPTCLLASPRAEAGVQRVGDAATLGTDS